MLPSSGWSARCRQAAHLQQRGTGLLTGGVERLLDPGQAVDEARAVALLGADTAQEHHPRDPVLPHRGGQPLPGALGVGTGVGQRPVVRVHPEDRLDAAGRLGHVLGIALVADSQLGLITHPCVGPAGVAQQQAETDTGLAQRPHDMRSDVASLPRVPAGRSSAAPCDARNRQQP